MRPSTLIARRFLFSPKSHSVINIISRVSMVAVGIPVAAMVILMSVFNGLDDLIRRMYTEFDPDLMVRPAEGKVFDPAILDTGAIAALDGVSGVSFILEESALVEYRGRQTTATIRGVDSLFGSVVAMDRLMWAGEFGGGGAVVGQGIAYELGIRVGMTEQMRFFVPRRGSYSSLVPINGFSATQASIDGVFMLDADTDSEYILAPIEFTRDLFDYPGRASSLAIRFAEDASAKRLKSEVARIAGDDFRVLTRYEQKASMYRVMKIEKWGVFFIGFIVLVIASFSIVGSLIMLIIDKRDGIRTLGALGASRRLVRGVFIRQGMMIGVIGAAGGLVLGVAICAVQQIFGVIPMPGATFLIDSYPVLMRPLDIAIICAAFLTVIYIITTFTVLKTIGRRDTGV